MVPAPPPPTLSPCPSPPGRDLPLCAQLFKYASWMGGDRDGNPAVTSLVTSHVVYLARWMAADMYLREIDALHFEVGWVGGGRGWGQVRGRLCGCRRAWGGVQGACGREIDAPTFEVGEGRARGEVPNSILCNAGRQRAITLPCALL